ncbi:hypothetical protein DT23_10385 [Thioclava indica]|uniref:Uncharacterized protein n=1 Tax=Thioclava indica TaxID=1353528 RepID=A0A074JXG2_9RHOB|nr:hypothetical protein DT23_10385 [Thioclava indica]
MLPGIGRLGAGSCTIRSQRRQDFLIRAICPLVLLIEQFLCEAGIAARHGSRLRGRAAAEVGPFPSWSSWTAHEYGHLRLFY